MQSTDVISPIAIGSPIALNGDKNIPSQNASGSATSSINLGFLPITSEPLDDGGIAPERVDFNGMFYLSTDQRVFLQNGGRITYNPNVAAAIGGYPKGAILDYIDSNGKYIFAKSLIENNNYNFITNPEYINDTYWQAIKLGGDSRYIGEIVTSPLPLSEAGLHLLDGSIISGDGIYSEFINYIASIYSSSLNCFTTEASWQSTVSQYGSCGKFVYNVTNNTVRLPKLTNILQPTNDINTLGNITLAGLPNITGQFTVDDWVGAGVNGAQPPTGVFFNTGINNQYDATSTTGKNQGWQLGFNASRSNSIYGNSPTVQPQTVRVFYYIVVATDTKTSIQVDIDNIVTDLNSKADIDLDNVPTSKGILKETYINGTSWYRVYSDGWCEQGGNMQTTATVTFLKPFSNANYSVIATLTNGSVSNYEPIIVTDKTTSSCKINNSRSRRCDWRAYGYIA